MKLVSFLRNGRIRSGVVINDNYIVDLNDSCYIMLSEKGALWATSELYKNL